MTKKTIFKIAGYYLLFVFGLVLILVGVGWYSYKQKLARQNLVRPNFPYTKYTDAELEKMFPQVYTVDVPTRQTPEQTYAKFIELLKVGNFEEASNQFFLRDLEIYPRNLDIDKTKQTKLIKSFKKVKENGLLENMIKDLDKKLDKIYLYDTSAQYSIGIEKDGKIFGDRIDFMKDIDGDWKIKSL